MTVFVEIERSVTLQSSMSTTSRNDSNNKYTCDQELLAISSITNAIKSFKIIAFVFHVLFFAFVINYKELRNRHTAFLVNLAMVGFVFVIYGLVSFDSDFICLTQSEELCEFQGLFSHYCLYLASFGVLVLAFYRLACVTVKNLNNFLKLPKIILTLSVVWLLPALTAILPKYILKIPITFNAKTSNCRMDLSKELGYFIFFIIVTNIIPSILIAVIYVTIIIKLHLSKRRINPLHQASIIQAIASTPLQPLNKITPVSAIEQTPHTDVSINTAVPQRPLAKSKIPNRARASLQSRLAFQFLVLYANFEVYAISNTFLQFELQTGPSNSTWTINQVGVFRVLIWLHYMINPILYLLFHPLIMDKLKEFIIKCLNKLMKLCTRRS